MLAPGKGNTACEPSIPYYSQVSIGEYYSKHNKIIIFSWWEHWMQIQVIIYFLREAHAVLLRVPSSFNFLTCKKFFFRPNKTGEILKRTTLICITIIKDNLSHYLSNQNLVWNSFTVRLVYFSWLIHNAVRHFYLEQNSRTQNKSCWNYTVHNSSVKWHPYHQWNCSAGRENDSCAYQKG